MLVVAGLLAFVVIVAMNSGPITSTQALRAARTTPSTIESPAAPFCRALAAQPVDVGDGPTYVGSAEQLAALRDLEAVATPTVRLHLGVLRHYLTDGDPDADAHTWPSGVQDAVASIEDFATDHC